MAKKTTKKTKAAGAKRGVRKEVEGAKRGRARSLTDATVAFIVAKAEENLTAEQILAFDKVKTTSGEKPSIATVNLAIRRELGARTRGRKAQPEAVQEMIEALYTGKNSDYFLSAAAVQDELAKKGVKVSVATIYNVLDARGVDRHSLSDFAGE